MQEFISQIAALGIKITPHHLTHYYLRHYFSDGDCRSPYSAQSGAAHLRKAGAGQQPPVAANYYQNKLFHRLAFTLRGIIVNVQAVLWLQKAARLRKSSPPAPSCG